MTDRSSDDPAAFPVIVRNARRPGEGPASAVARGLRTLQRGLDGATALLGDVYAVGARHLMTRTERLEDHLAERQARKLARTHSRVHAHAPASPPSATPSQTEH